MKVYINGKLKDAEILNERKECLYRWKSNKLMSYDLELQMPSGASAAHINEKSMLLSPRLEVHINGKDCGFVSQKLKFLSEQYFYEEKGWQLKKKSPVKELKATNGSGNTVFVFRSAKNRTSRFDNCELEVANEAELLPALCMLEAVFCFIELTASASAAAGFYAARS